MLKKKFYFKILLVAFVLLGFSSKAWAIATFDEINNTNPSLGDELIVYGGGLQDDAYTAIIYPADQPAVKHYPNNTLWNGTEYHFTLGNGEGETLTAGTSYVFNFELGGDIIGAGLNFTIKSNSGGEQCSDTDPFNDVAIKGIVSGFEGDTTRSGEDYCGEDDKTLYQAECAGGVVGYSEILCDDRCENGVCVQGVQSEETVCKTTDSNLDIFTFGTATYGNDSISDYCGEDGKTIYQATCVNEKELGYVEATTCPDYCTQGVCARTSSESKQSVAKTCEDSDLNDDPYLFGQVKLDGEAAGKDICDEGVVYQASCGADGKVEYRGYNCSAGCSNGQCNALDQTTIIPAPIASDLWLGATPLPSPIEDDAFDEAYEQTQGQDIGNLLNLAYQKGNLDFKDVNSSDWYFPFVRQVQKAGIVDGRTTKEGVSTGIFSPNERLNAAEAHKFVLQAANIVVPTVTQGQSWYTPYFNVAKQVNLSSQNFPPAKLVTRGDVACMIAEALNLQKVSIPSGNNFTDIQSTHPQYLCLGAMVVNGIMSGDSNGSTIRPDGLINRAEMSKMIGLTMEKVNLSNAYQCPAAKDVNNIRVYGLTVEPVYVKANQIKKTSAGDYMVKVTAQVQSFNIKNTLNNVELTLFRHDLQQVNNNEYKEIIKQVKVPYAWQNATIRPGYIETLTAEIPVPKSPHFVGKNYVKPYEYVDFTVMADIPSNSVEETLDIADNIATARGVLEVSQDPFVNTGLPKLITQRQIQTKGQAVKSAVSGPLGTQTTNINIGDVGTGFINAQAYAPYPNGSLSDVEFANYSYRGLNPYQSHYEVLTAYVRSLSIKNLDAVTKNCVNFSPSMLEINEMGVEEDGRIKVQIKGAVKKSGAISIVSSGVYHTVYYKEKNSQKPWRVAYSQSHNSNDDGSQDPYIDSFDVITLIKATRPELEFKLVADEGHRMQETIETDNELSIDKTLTQFTAAQAKLCKFDFLVDQDLWLMSLQGSVKQNNKVEVEIQVQNASGQDLKGVEISLFRHEVDGQKQFSIKELSVPSWKSVDIQVGRIKTLTALVDAPNDLRSMIFNGTNELGYVYTAAVDLPGNKVAEFDEIGNNYKWGFVKIRSLSSASAGDYIPYSIDQMFEKGGSLLPLNGSAFGWRNWRQYFTSRYKVPLIDQKYVDKHNQCTSIKTLSPAFIQSLKSDDAQKLKFHVEFPLQKTGYLPLMEKGTIAELLYRGSGSGAWQSVHRWENYSIGLSDGRNSNLTNTKLTADVEVLAQNASSAQFQIKIDPDNEYPKSNTMNLTAIYGAALANSNQVDLTIDSVTYDYVKLPKSGSTPTVTASYVVRNLGAADVKNPVKVNIIDRDTNKVIHTFTVPYIQNGAYQGITIIDLPSQLKPSYRWTYVVDPDNKVPLDVSRSNNKVQFNEWNVRAISDQGVDLKVGKLTAHKVYGNYMKIPLTYTFFNLNSSGQAYYETKQKFPLSPLLEKNVTKHKPHFSGQGYHQFISKTIKYVEDYFDDFVALRGGVVRLSCSGSNCSPQYGSIKGYTDMEINDEASKTIYAPFGLDWITERNAKYYSDNPIGEKFIYDAKKTKDLWVVGDPYTRSEDDKAIRKIDYDFDLDLELGSGKSEYLIYGYLSRGWASFYKPQESLDSYTWWGPLFDLFLYSRTAFANYQDDWGYNNYQIYKVTIENKKITDVKELTSTGAYLLTKNNLSKYGSDFNEFLKQYYSSFPN